MLSWLDSQLIDRRRSRAAISSTAVRGALHDKLRVERVQGHMNISRRQTDMHVRAHAASGVVEHVKHAPVHPNRRQRAGSNQMLGRGECGSHEVGWFK